MRWTKQDCERLLALKQQTNPKLTCDQIAAELNVSRKAVVAKYGMLTRRWNAPKRKRAKPERLTRLAYERNGERWIPEENLDLVRRVEAGELYPAIGIAMNRTAWACKAQYAILKRLGAASLSEADLARQAEREALEAALQRTQHLPQPASLTAWICGDPLPGPQRARCQAGGCGAMSLRAQIVALLTSHRLTLADEKALQAEIATVLTAAKLSFQREVRLGPGDIVDVLVDDPADPLHACAIECKIKGRARTIYRQLERYCGYGRVAEIVLATNVPMNLPDKILGKPTAIANLGRGWL